MSVSGLQARVATPDPRIEALQAALARGELTAAALVDQLTDPSWPLRRVLIAALAAMGELALPALLDALRTRRDDEARIAAVVDALSASVGHVEPLIAPLAKHDDAAVVADVAQVLGRRRRGLPILISLTNHPDDNVAVAAIEGLGRIGGQSAVDALVACVEGNNFFRVFPAVDVLGRSADPRAIAPLARLLKNPRYAFEAARALGRTADRGAVAPLLELLRAPSEASLRVACLALSELCELHAERYGVTTAIESSLYAGRSDSLVRRIGQQLEGAGKAEKVAMCRVLGAMHGSAAAEWLLPLLDGEAEVARAAGDALASLGRDSDGTIALALREHNSERRAVLLPGVTRLDQAEAVVLCLDDPAPNVRALAAQTLARIGYVAAASALFVRLADDSPHVAHAANAAIQALGSSDTERLALEAAQSPLREVRRAALRILAYFGYESSLPLFEAALRDHADDARMRDAAVQGLTLLEQPEARALLLRTSESSDAKLRAAATRALGHVTASTESLVRLHAGLSDPDSWVRYYACQAIGRLGEPAAASTDAVVTLLSDPAGHVRVAAIEALSHLPSESAILALRRSARADDPDVRRAALLGLGLAGDQTSLPTLLDAAREDDAPTRLIALSALANFHDPRVTAALAAAARDADEAVRTAAVGFLQASTEPDASASLIALVRDGVEAKRALDALAAAPVSDSALINRSAAMLHGLEQADDAVAPLLASSLSKLGGPRAEAALLSALVSKSRPARLAAANALAALGTRDAYAALAKAASDDVDDEVRRVCALHLAG